MHASPAGSQQSPHGAKPPSHIILGSLGNSGRFELAISSLYLSLEAFPTPTHFTTSVHFQVFCFFAFLFFFLLRSFLFKSVKASLRILRDTKALLL